MKYKLKIKGLDSPDGTISIRAEDEVIKPAEEGEEVFERMPTPPKRIRPRLSRL